MAMTVIEMVGRVLRREDAGEQPGFAVCSRAVALHDKLLDEFESADIAC
jgi:hypothetical protein